MVQDSVDLGSHIKNLIWFPVAVSVTNLKHMQLRSSFQHISITLMQSLYSASAWIVIHINDTV